VRDEQDELIGVMYLRCSGDKQAKKESSLPAQRREIERQAERDGVTLVQTFTDEGISGKLLADRDAMNEMLAYLAKHKGDISVAYVYDASRMARNRRDAIFIRDECERLGVRLCSVAQPDTDDESTNILLHGLWDGMAHAYSVKLGKDVRRGIKQALLEGLWPWPGAAFGFRREATPNTRGSVRWKLVVHEEEAAVVRYIFELYFLGLGFKAIAARLTDEGIAPPERSDMAKLRLVGAWRGKHVQRILGGNPLYYGMVENQGEMFRVSEGIVDQETWDRARALSATRMRKKSEVGGNMGAGKIADHGVLRPWLRCACGGPIAVVRGGHTGHRHFYYSCRARQDNRASCKGITCRTEVLDEIVLSAIERILIDPVFIADLIKKALLVMAEDQGGQVRERRTLLSDRIKELDRKIRATAMQVTDGLIEASDAKAMNAPMLTDRDAARAELATLPEPEGVPRFEDIDADVFRGDILDSYRADEVGVRRTALDRIITEIRLEPGVAVVQYAWKDAGSPEPYQAPDGPPNAPKSDRDPSTSNNAGSPASINGLPAFSSK
jgi:DNA invertase Pin-like site-specific DNA recombinase